MANSYPKLFEPFSIGSMTLRNRTVMPAMLTNLCEPDGTVGDAAIAYYARRAAGGVGMVTLEISAVHPSGRAYRCNSLLYRDESMDGLSRLASAIHGHGARLSLQLWHPGYIADAEVIGRRPFGASDVPAPGTAEPPEVLSSAMIEELVEAYGDAARRAQAVGADAVEIHGGHGYLITQFLSRLSNRRTDRYGGPLENRARFLLDVASSVRDKVGPRFPVLCKLSAAEHVDGGITIEETVAVAGWLERSGVDALVISSGSRYAGEWTVQPALLPRGCLVPFAERVKRSVGIPVGAIGRINDPGLAESVLREGKADFVVVGRALIADPEFLAKARDGRAEEIRPCAACRVCVNRSGASKQPIRCMVNAEAGRELELKSEPAAARKRVLVVGGGPAGMATARSAATRGHSVALWERSAYLGGMVAAGSVPQSKAELRGLVDYYRAELKRLDVDVALDQPATAEAIRELRPDVVVTAVGSRPITPDMPGLGSANPVHARDVLAGQVAVGRSAIVLGGGSVGCETAEYLRAKGAEVTVLELLADFARDMEPITRKVFLTRLGESGVKLVGNARVVRVEGRQIFYVDAASEEMSVQADTLVLAVGARADTAQVEALKAAGVPVVAVGDCVEPRKIQDAIYEGELAGRSI